jgi:coenzyme F420-0:L-glutamate ligase/coenzyme F420-1:gamma-L-glutamate ligase
MEQLTLRALHGMPEVAPGTDLAALVESAAKASGVTLRNGVLAVCQKIVSKAEGRMVSLIGIEPRDEARKIADEDGKDARAVELVLRESVRIVRRSQGVLISETAHGFVCANAGVDLSNTPADDMAVLLPVDPDASARALRDALVARGAGPLGVLVTDTFGRPFREGLVDVALGSAGFAPLDDQRGGTDRRGRTLQVTTLATADAVAAAAGLLMHKDAGIPAVWIEGVPLGDDVPTTVLLRDPKLDLFR